MLSWMREVFVFAICRRTALLLDVGGPGRCLLEFEVSYSHLSGTCMVQDLMFKLGFPLHKSSKMEENLSSLLIWKQNVISTLNLPQQRGDRITPFIRFTPKPNARYRVCNAPKQVRYRDTHLCSHFHSSGQTLVAFCGEDAETWVKWV